MLIYFIVALVSSNLALGENQTNKNEERENGVINFKIKKSLDIQVDGKNVKNWDSNLNNLLDGQMLEGSRGKSSDWIEPPVVRATPEFRNRTFHNEPIGTYSQDNSKSNKDQINNIYDRIQNILDNYNSLSLSKIEDGDISNAEFCKRIVGLSKSPSCQYIEENHVNYYRSTKNNIPKSCRDIQESGKNKSGIYEIQPKSSLEPFMVFCDMETRGGGWTVIQNRFDGSEDFYREWRDYKFGFGNLNKEYWIGLEHIYHITGFELSELLIELTDRDKLKAYAHYNRFALGPEKDGYTLNVLSGFSGDAGDSLTDHFNQKFSTKDMDQDTNPANCAELYRGGWWYKTCHVSNLNGKYINLALPEKYKYQGLHWLKYRGHEYCHAGSRMMVRPVQP